MANPNYPSATEQQDKFLVTGVSVALTKAKKEYATVKLVKDNKQYEGKIWNWDDTMSIIVQTGNVIRAVYREDVYQGKTQINIFSAAKVEGDISSFMRSAISGTPEELWKMAVAIVHEFDEPFVKFVAEDLLTHPLIVDNIKTSPAAITVHSNWVAGLLEHGLSMVDMGASVYENYVKWAPKLSLSKIGFGCLFHDIGKCIEYSRKGAAYVSTPMGELANHIVFGPALVWESYLKWKAAGNKASEFEAAELMHIIASHHGTLEHGSPVPPRTLEALIVHQLDALDGQFMHAWDMIQQGPGEPDSLMTGSSYFHKTKYFLQEVTSGPSRKNEPAGVDGAAPEDEDTPW
jgi:3'-5' exoribonuclease